MSVLWFGLTSIIEAQHQRSMFACVLCVLYVHRCWAYSPPGGLLSSSLSVDMCDWCTSVVIGRDMIPRLSAK